MKTRIAPVAAALAAMFIALSAVAAGPGWTTDYDAAVIRARNEKKVLFLNFTTADKGLVTARLNKEILDEPKFKTWAQGRLVLVELVMAPKDKVKPDALERNKELAKKYGVLEFPFVVLADAEGNKLGETGYIKGGPDPFLKKLGQILGAR